MEDELLGLSLELAKVWHAARVPCMFRDWQAPARKKASGVRGRKRSVYASLPGIKMIRIRKQNQYVRRTGFGI